MKKKSICILTQSHLCRNPRVLKEAALLATNGYEVHVFTNSISQELYRQDIALIAPYKVRLHLVSNLQGKGAFADRLLTKLGRFLTKKFGIQTKLALGYGAGRYLAVCKKLNTDLYICHQELATYVGGQLVDQGYEVAFDLEDWYSEDLLPSARAERPLQLLQQAEAKALAESKFVFTTSHAMANAIATNYQTETPGVIYNVFPRLQIPFPDKTFAAPVKLFWFSQTIGAGRGLEGFIQLLTNIEAEIELHLLGTVDESYKSTLTSLMTAKHPVFFHPLVPEAELMVKIGTFDVGLALEMAQPPSRNFTITNKFFQYIQCGLPVIATATAGQQEAFEKHHPGILLPQQPAEADIAIIQDWLNDAVAIQASAARAKNAAEHYNWENESKKLLQLVNHALR